uniref:Vomeronasal type-1 receptor n=1 Tax=Erpetoichthys calabaricus TaxID=27687 RepID=A0A8C4SX65_ERPCA
NNLKGLGIMDTTDTRLVLKAAAFLILTAISIPANIFVCIAFLQTLVTEGKLMTADIILCHLAFANLMVALVRSIPQTMAAFGSKDMFDDDGCKMAIFCFRVFRGLSISLTCLLSTYQAVLVSPATSRLAPLKSKIPEYLMHIIFILYIMNCVSYSNTLLNSVASFPNNTIPLYTFNLQFCFITYPTYIDFISGGLTKFFSDLLFIVLMAIMSGYILVVLYRHGKRVRSLRSSDSSQSGARAEVKALLYHHGKKMKNILSSDNSQKGRRAEAKASRAVVTLVILFSTMKGNFGVSLHNEDINCPPFTIYLQSLCMQIETFSTPGMMDGWMDRIIFG